jgi:NAD(P)-dependent dehydrogenase (short-subunit alcohol dehydrogenase family)
LGVPGDDLTFIQRKGENALPTSTDWTNQVALVTGSSRGIGAAIARRLAAQGAAVCLNCAASTTDADVVAGGIRAAGGRAIVVQADIANAESVDRMVARAEMELGPLTILVNNAGVSSSGAGSLETYDAARMARMRAINADGVIHTVRAVAPGMKARGYGRIVNIASNAAIGTSLAGTTFYAASKAEVLILTRRFAMELGRSGITVNCVAPGWVVTEMTRAGHSEAEFAERVKAMSERSMLGRVGAPEDIAAAVAFLASPEARYLTAQVLTVDGGRIDYIGHG